MIPQFSKVQLRCAPWSFLRSQYENVGDVFNKFLLEDLTGLEIKPVLHAAPRKLLAVGSILSSALADDVVVWGSGGALASSPMPHYRNVICTAVRGPLSHEMLQRSGYDCPAIYGDPGLLAPLFYPVQHDKKHKIGLVLHHSHAVIYPINTNAHIISTLVPSSRSGLMGFLEAINECEYILSSSLHGLIFAHAYGIPAGWICFGDVPHVEYHFKFFDYYAGVGQPQPTMLEVSPKQYIDAKAFIPQIETHLALSFEPQQLLAAFPWDRLPLETTDGGEEQNLISIQKVLSPYVDEEPLSGHKYSIHYPSSYRLPADSLFFRRPFAPTNYIRHSRIVETFDYKTIFYDVFFSDDHRHVIIICPQWNNLEPYMRKMKFYLIDNISHKNKKLCKPCFITTGQIVQIVLDNEEGYKHLQVLSAFGKATMAIDENKSDLFAGKRVLLTKQKNNKLQWIVDWCNFNSVLHGFDSLLIFENRSTDYSKEELYDALQKNTNLDRIVIVDWPYEFGSPFETHGTHYSDYGLLRVGYMKYLSKSLCYTAIDIDEIIVCEDKEPLFSKVDRSESGIVVFGGRWIDKLEHRDLPLPNKLASPSSDFFLGGTDCGPCQSKYIVKGGSIDPEDILGNHCVLKKDGEIPLGDSQGVSLRHFHYISTNWNANRTETSLRDIPERKIFADTILIEQFSNLSKTLRGYEYNLEGYNSYIRESKLPMLPRKINTYLNVRQQVQESRDIYGLMRGRELETSIMGLGRLASADSVVVAFNPELKMLLKMCDCPKIFTIHSFVEGRRHTLRLLNDSRLLHARESEQLHIHKAGPLSASLQKYASNSSLYIRILRRRLWKKFSHINADIYHAGQKKNRLVFACWAASVAKRGSLLFVPDIFKVSVEQLDLFFEYIKPSEFLGHAAVFEMYGSDKQRQLIQKMGFFN